MEDTAVNVLLLAPGFSIGERYNYKTKTQRGYLPPLGLGYIAAVLEEAGHRVRIVDIPLSGYTELDILAVARNFHAELVGLSVLTPAAPRALSLARYLKHYLQVPFVFGGPHASSFPTDCLQSEDDGDIVVVGEGEETMLELVDRLAEEVSYEDVLGICYRQDGRVVQNPPRMYISSLDTLPFPARHLFDMPHYVPLANNYRWLPATNMITSRGCPYHCSFCFEGGKGGLHYRRLSPERAIEEIRHVVKTYDIREISFWDDNFVISKNWIMEFCEQLSASGQDISWSCFSRVDRVSPEILRAMARAGCWNIFFGLEAGSQVLLDNIKKGTTIEQNRSAVAWTKEAGIEVRASFMLGLPGETPPLGRQTIDFAIELDPDYAQFTPTTPMPGTKLYEDCLKTGKLEPDFSQYTLWSVLFVPEGYKNAEEIRQLRREAQRRFYLRPKYIWGRLRKIRSWEDLKRYIQGLLVILGMSK